MFVAWPARSGQHPVAAPPVSSAYVVKKERKTLFILRCPAFLRAVPPMPLHLNVNPTRKYALPPSEKKSDEKYVSE
jgi:hypothetical protein